ncbi:hypothetical protein Pryu01_01135 [Paraliobacillus ryukyuensis]|uniref:Uncharacterized protein n=1 Tax=Paraliobacillus ryukyuensis TaxID=200904 RepID=A0A366ED96_9BACI|nr:hypothetical protein [Paraliobacillus ryukyuensis]RBP00293.1 hypothetical protein DES48_10254 [Paraliobacillus ryukyuensis]
MPVYRKLVRDNIIAIIKANKQHPQFRILSANAYRDALIDKLREEVEELNRANQLSDKKMLEK